MLDVYFHVYEKQKTFPPIFITVLSHRFANNNLIKATSFLSQKINVKEG